MTIRNPELLTQTLIHWCQQKAKEAKVTGAVVGVSGGVDSAVTLAICVRAFPGRVTGVMMPCHSSKESLSRSEELFDALGRDKVSVQLINLEEAFASISSQFHCQDSFDKNFVYGGLRSCLRAPTLDFIAKATNSLVFGTGNRDEDEIFRYYQKRGDGAVDNNVLACLHKSEVWDLAKYLGVPKSIIAAIPTADLWGSEKEQTDEGELGISYAEIEWVTRENDRLGILNAEGEPEKIISAFEKLCNITYTERERFVLLKSFQAERTTRHKAEPPPAPSREELFNLGLVE